MEPGHPLHSALTRPSSANSRRLKSRHPFVPAAQQLICLSDNNNIRAAQWADHQWNAEWADNPTRLRTLIPDTGTHTPAMTLPRRAWVRLNHLCTGVGRFHSCLYKWGMASCAALSVAQNKPSTMSSSNVQSIDLSMDCTAWRFWTMRQLNGCSTPASKSSAAKQWITEERAQTNEEEQLISSSDDNNTSAVECRKVGVHNETPYFHPRPTLLEWHCQDQRAVVQPECGRRGHDPFRNKLDKIFTGALYQYSIVRK